MMSPKPRPPAKKPEAVKRLRYKRLSAETKRLLHTEGESGRFEFKSTAQAVSPKVLVAAANAATTSGEHEVTILVGVEEHEDPETGLVTGRVIGLEMAIERAREKITAWGQTTQPVPIGLTIIEENVATSKPILRLIVRPQRAPHYDEGGRRVTRYGASTRALTDDELLQIYLLREASAFQQRFAIIAEDLEAALEEIHAVAQQAASDSSDAASDAWSGKTEAEGAATEVQRLAHWVKNRLPPLELTHGGLFMKLLKARRDGWELFVSSTPSHVRVIPEIAEAEALMEEVLATTPIPEDFLRNFTEKTRWDELRKAAEEHVEADRAMTSETLLTFVKEIHYARLGGPLSLRKPDTREEIEARLRASEG